MPRLEDQLTGKVTLLKRGSVVVERPQIDKTPLDSYISKALPLFNPELLRARFGDLICEGPIVFFDLETSGLGRKASIVSLAYSVLEDCQLSSYCVFPSDPGLEGEAITHFLRRFHQGATFVTFNGSSFDVPKLSDRARQWSVQANGNPIQTFADHAAERHIDTYPIARRTFRFVKGQAGYNSLQGIERLEFGYEREDDLPGRMIPEVYRRWVYKRDNIPQVAQLIEHNMQDNITNAAILLKLLEKRN
jgi:uncharacterized protein